MSDARIDDEIVLFCDRCSTQLHPGDGSFYVVKIEAMADPTPPAVHELGQPYDINTELARIIEETKEFSEQELMDQVYRRLTLYLCGPCYRHWIENPVQ